jgi:hypothetical protein
MAFSLEEQARLGEIYAPILFLSRNDVAPISPAEFVRRSALWSYPGPLDGPFGSEHDKQSWEAPTVELMPGRLAASEDDPDIANRTLVWTHIDDDPAPAYFLDHGGWDDLNPTETLPLPSVGEVTETTENLMGSVAAAKGRWSYREPHPQLDSHIGWYSVQAFDAVNDLGQLIQKLSGQEDPAADHLMDVISRLPQPSWLVFYHFFFPGRSEWISNCELIHTLQALGIDVDGAELNAPENAFPTFQLVALGFPYALQWAAYIGQFVTIAVVAPAPIGDTPSKILSPLEADDDQFLQPMFVGFGRTTAAVEPLPTGPPVEVPLMDVVSADEVDFDGNHVHVFVSEANHNTYPKTGQFPTPKDDTRVSICDWATSNLGAVGESGEPAPAGPTSEQLNSVILAKFLTLGIVVGAIASWAEALGGTRPSGAGNGTPTDTPELGGDAAQKDPEGLILAPAEIIDTFSEEAAFVRPWAGTAAQRVFDERWETVELSWGPPALQDPFRRRRGRPMARYIGPFISALGQHLEDSG